MSIQEETDLIDLLKDMNNGSKEIKNQIERAERRLRKLVREEEARRERKSFVRRIEREVGQQKLAMYLAQHGLPHLCGIFQHMTLDEFHHSDTLDWPPLGEPELRQLLFIRH
jgi:hypothetical protein